LFLSGPSDNEENIFENLRDIKKVICSNMCERHMFNSEITVFSQEAILLMAEIPQYLDAKHKN